MSANAIRARLRRRFPRLTLRVDVIVESEAGRLDAVATTLGAGGLFVATDSPLPRGSLVTVGFRLPGEGERLHFDAHVVWNAMPAEGVASAGMGIEFDDPAARAAQAARLEQWATRNASRFDPDD